MSALDAVLQEFHRDVERAEHLLNLIKSFREFGASTPPENKPDPQNLWPSASALHDASKQRRTDIPVLSGSLQLYLAGRFEYCIRQIVEVLSDEIATRASKYTDLPESIRGELRAKTLEIALNPRRYGYNEAQTDALLASLVASKSATSAPVAISSTVLTLTDTNMRDRVLADLLKRVGMLDYWREVGKQATVKLLLETSTDGETSLQAQSKLNSIMDERNQVAHPTSSTQFPDPDQVLRSAAFLRTLATTTVDLGKIHLSGFKTSST